MTILVLHDAVASDAAPDELDTLVQVGQVSEALRRAGHVVVHQEFTADTAHMLESIGSLHPDAAFNLVETLGGGKLIHMAPWVCSELGIPCTGCSFGALVDSSDKLRAKTLLRQAGIPTPDWHGPGMDFADISCHGLLGCPVIVKPVSEEGSVGIDDGSVREFASLEELVGVVESSPRPVFIERFIDGREFSVALMPSEGAVRVLPVSEIVFCGYGNGKPRIVGYEAKWIEDSFEYSHTVRSFACNHGEKDLVGRLTDLAITCWRLFGARGHARVDVRVDPAGNPFVLEVNFNPCVARDSGFSAAAAEAGYAYDQMICHIVQEAVWMR